MKRPGPTLLVRLRETGSVTDMQLVLHKQLAGVCLSYYSGYLIAMGELEKVNKQLIDPCCGFA